MRLCRSAGSCLRCSSFQGIRALRTSLVREPGYTLIESLVKASGMLFTRTHRSLGAYTFTAFPHPSLMFLAFFLVLGGDRVLVGASNVTCPSSYDWAMNSLKQNPCAIASRLQGICDGGFEIDTLPPGYHYVGPESTNPRFLPNYCSCTSVVYELMSACGSCQNRTFISFTSWTIDCTNFTSPQGTYQDSLIPVDTAIPQWAFLKPSNYLDSYNEEAAKLVGDFPETSRIFSSTTSSGSTTSSIPTTTDRKSVV